MEIDIVEPVRLEDGKHEGAITEVQFRTEPYKYMDVVIETQGKDRVIPLKYGVPYSDNVTEMTKLGRLLREFTELKIGEKVDPEKILLGKKVTFQTQMDKSDKGEFCRILNGTVKPL